MDRNIIAHKLKITSNIHSQFEPVNSSNDTIEKGRIAESLTYGSQKITISKTGKQIKDAVDVVMSNCESEKTILMEKMKACLKQASSAPTRKADSYMLKGCESKMEFIPKFFSWDDCKKHRPQSTQSNNIQLASDKVEEVNSSNCCEDYNMHARQYISKCVDYCFLHTIKNGVSDKKSYELSIEQCVNLGL